MHRCFLVPELVQHICEEINNSRARGRARKTLVALAQTRKLFQEPALNLVWHTLERLEPLVKCLPSDVWELRKTHGGVFVLVSLLDLHKQFLATHSLPSGRASKEPFLRLIGQDLRKMLSVSAS